MVSGKYFFPKAPLLCLKRMPACVVTSVNSIVPVGRGGVELGLGDGAALATSVCVATGGAADCLHDEIRNRNVVRNKMIESIRIGIKVILCASSVFSVSLWFAVCRDL